MIKIESGQLYTYKQIAEYFGKKIITIQKWVKAGIIETVQISGSKFITGDFIIKMVAESVEKANEKRELAKEVNGAEEEVLLG